MTAKLAFAIVFVSMALFTSCAPPSPVDPGIGDELIFSLPGSMTGLTQTRSVSRALSTQTVATINTFFRTVRDQVLFADSVGYLARSWLNRLEAAGVFGLTSPFTATLTGTDAGDRVRWTPGPPGEYLLEWWKLQLDGVSFQKFAEIDFDHYSRDASGLLTARGTITVDVTAYPNLALQDGFTANPTGVRVAFDTNTVAEGKRYLKIEVEGFMEEHLNGTVEQKCVISATMDASGVIEVSGSTYVPGVGVLTYAASPDDVTPSHTEEWEYRYYVYKAKGVWDRAAVSLGMPLNAYAEGTVFSYPNDVGGVVSEYVADMLRDDGDTNRNGTKQTGEVGDGHWLLTAMSLAGPFDYATSSPATDLIRAAIPDPATNPAYEDIYTLTHISNPVYFETQSYHSFGAVPPAGWEGYDPATVTVPFVTQGEVDSLDLAGITSGWSDAAP